MPYSAAHHDPPLTRRELEILRLLTQGRSNSEIAKILWVTDQVIKFHLTNLYRKLDVSNRTEAAHWAIAHGCIRPDDDEPETGVREPRRPIKPSLIGGVALDPPDPEPAADDVRPEAA